MNAQGYLTLPRRFLGLVVAAQEPEQTYTREEVTRSLDEALTWLRRQEWTLTRDGDEPRRRCVKTWQFLAFLVATGRAGHTTVRRER